MTTRQVKKREPLAVGSPDSRGDTWAGAHVRATLFGAGIAQQPRQRRGFVIVDFGANGLFEINKASLFRL